MKVLVIEDNLELGQDIIDYLSSHQIIVEWVQSFRLAEEKLISFDYHVVVIDIMLGDGNGLELVRLIKDIQSTAAIMIISAKDSLEDKVKGLELGADDYLSKPFHLAELKARLNAIYRRNNLNGFNQIIFNEISIDTNERLVKVQEEVIVLTSKEYELLLLFLSNKNKVLSKNMIAEYLWGDYIDSADNFDFIYQHIKNLRKKLAKADCPSYIGNVYGIGYKFSTHV